MKLRSELNKIRQLHGRWRLALGDDHVTAPVESYGARELFLFEEANSRVEDVRHLFDAATRGRYIHLDCITAVVFEEDITHEAF